MKLSVAPTVVKELRNCGIKSPAVVVVGYYPDVIQSDWLKLRVIYELKTFFVFGAHTVSFAFGTEVI